MLKNIELLFQNKFRKKYLKLFALLFLSFLFIHSFIDPVWGYDEYASVITHLELDDTRITSRYIDILKNIGFSNSLSNNIVDFIFPVIIVPIRWTYALGISPIYEISRLNFIEWSNLRIFLLLIHSVLNSVGFYFIIKSIKSKSVFLIFLFLSFIILSPSFIYWTLTLSPYSFHLFCFGLILKSEINTKTSNQIFNKKNILRTITVIFNYQYIPVVLFLILKDIFLNLRNKISIIYQSILPIFISIISIIFVVLRSKISGKHSSPNLSILSGSDIDIYDFTYNYNQFFEFFVSRFYDIFLYFFQSKNYHFLLSNNYSQIPKYLSILILIVITFIIFNYKKKITSPILTSLIFIFTSTILYIFNIYPFMPSRHSLVIFLPFMLILTLIIDSLFEIEFLKNFKKYFAILLLIFSLVRFNNIYVISTPALDINYLKNTLASNKTDRLILSNCEQEPLFNISQIKIYNPLYKCGPFIMEKLNKNPINIALYSINELSEKEIISEVSHFIEFEFELKDLSFTSQGKFENNLIHNIYSFKINRND